MTSLRTVWALVADVTLKLIWRILKLGSGRGAGANATWGQPETGTRLGAPSTGTLIAPMSGCGTGGGGGTALPAAASLHISTVLFGLTARTDCHSSSGIGPMSSGTSNRIAPDRLQP